MTVWLKGLLSSRKFYLSECLTPTAVNAAGCDQQLAAQPFGLTDSSGKGSTSLTVHSSAEDRSTAPS